MLFLTDEHYLTQTAPFSTVTATGEKGHIPWKNGTKIISMGKLGDREHAQKITD